MEIFFMGIVSFYFLVKTVYFFTNKIEEIEKQIIRIKEWDWIDGDKQSE
jgi:hypothetical protein